ncbi:MAG: molybdopterin biosynthesis protein [Deltaproteobacteria bacterium]|nr:MAG: molybdopterin biosynthesis protein [Deltaproteobacteria bacterium]
MSRRIYLNDVPLGKAVGEFLAALESEGMGMLEPETVELERAAGRVCAEDVWARVCSPHYHACAVDGYAVRAGDCEGASETSPVYLEPGSQAVEVNTGEPLPEGYDAVVMVEHTNLVEREGSPAVEIMQPVHPWQNVRLVGEDIVAGELVVPRNKVLQPADLGAIAAAGHGTVAVRRKPRVAVIPTGSELVPAGRDPVPGKIYEFNSITIAASLRQWGAEAERLDPVDDVPELIEKAVRDAVERFDMVVVNAGSSAGTRDYTATVVEKLGKLVVHGIAIRPGHPVVLGIVGRKPVLGIPGYPVSALLSLELLARPVIARWLGVRLQQPGRVNATLVRKLFSPFGKDEFVRVCVGRVGERLVAVPLGRGAGVISSLSRASGILRIPSHSEGFHAGATVEVDALLPQEQLENTIMCIGSHDPALDLLASWIAQRTEGVSLFTSHVGSTAGLKALAEGYAHLGGCHLLDEETGEYNLQAVKKMLRGREVVILGFVYRLQGLMVPKGNPKGIRTIEDLARQDVTFINRQRGTGTRVLLDYNLRKLGMSPDAIKGYQRQAGTHLAVAAAVASGAADCGLGVLSAARAMGLDFIEVARERYDLVIPVEHYRSDLLRPLLDVVRDRDFQRAVEKMGGYVTEDMGRPLYIVREDGSHEQPSSEP